MISCNNPYFVSHSICIHKNIICVSCDDNNNGGGGGGFVVVVVVGRWLTVNLPFFLRSDFGDEDDDDDDDDDGSSLILLAVVVALFTICC